MIHDGNESMYLPIKANKIRMKLEKLKLYPKPMLKSAEDEIIIPLSTVKNESTSSKAKKGKIKKTIPNKIKPTHSLYLFLYNTKTPSTAG